MNESIIAARGRTTIPADIRRSIGGIPGAHLVWHLMADGRLFVCVKNKPVAGLKGKRAGTDTTFAEVEKSRARDLANRHVIWDACLAEGKCKND